MAIWRRCSKRTCTNLRRCLEHLYFDVTHRGTRYRVPANEFAIPRMDPDKQRPIQSLEESTRLGACVHRPDQSRARSSSAEARAEAVECRADGRCQLSGRVR